MSDKNQLEPFIKIAKSIPPYWPNTGILTFSQTDAGATYMDYISPMDDKEGITIKQWRELLKIK